MIRALPLAVLVGLARGKAALSQGHGSSDHKGVRNIHIDPISAAVHPHPRPHHLLHIDMPSLSNAASLGPPLWITGMLTCGVTGLTGAVVTHPQWAQARVRCFRRREQSPPTLPAPDPGPGRGGYVSGSIIPWIASLALVVALGARAGARCYARRRAHSVQNKDLIEDYYEEEEDDEDEETSCEFHRMHSELAQNYNGVVRRVTPERQQRKSEVEGVYDSLAAEFHRLATPGPESGGFVRKRTLELNRAAEVSEPLRKNSNSKVNPELDAQGA